MYSFAQTRHKDRSRISVAQRNMNDKTVASEVPEIEPKASTHQNGIVTSVTLKRDVHHAFSVSNGQRIAPQRRRASLLLSDEEPQEGGL